MIEHAYIHIPFCKRKCKYCDFVSGKNIKDKDAYFEALIKEIKAEYKNEILKTLYFGGGTPFLSDVEDIKRIKDCFILMPDAEITIEANPESINYDKAKGMKEIGINRISLGIQSFDNNLLKLIGRVHDENTIFEAVKQITRAGFENISIDLIYGLPTQTLNIFKSDLKKALSLNIKHISTYGLKIEENSYFGQHLPENLPDDECQSEMFLYLCEFLKANGFEHYEISNFAKKDYHSKHNCAYWQNKEYYGFGVNASGYVQNARYRNISDFNEYITSPVKKEEIIELTKKEQCENEIFLALRLNSGINIERINKKYGINFEERYKKITDKYQKLNLLELSSGQCKLTEKGILLSNEIMCEFLD